MELWKNKSMWKTLLAVLTVTAILAGLLAGCTQSPAAGPTDPTETTRETTQSPATSEPTQPVQTLPPAVWETTPELGATYEQWLAAAMFMVIPLQYPDFQLEGMYAASQTGLEQKAASQGVYFCFQSGGEQVWIHSAPLASNRSEKGTTDLHTAQLGYASFDVVDAVDVSTMAELSITDLTEPMRYTVLPGLTVN